MSTQTLKDSKFRIIGHIETRSDGVQVLKNDRFVILGYYDPRSNQTKDGRFRIVGTGNLLTSLLGQF